MVTLDFDHAILDRTAGTAEFLQSGGERFERRRLKRQSCDHRNALAGTSGHLPADAHACAGAGARRRIKSAAAKRRRCVAQHHAAECAFGLQVVLPATILPNS